MENIFSISERTAVFDKHMPGPSNRPGNSHSQGQGHSLLTAFRTSNYHPILCARTLLRLEHRRGVRSVRARRDSAQSGAHEAQRSRDPIVRTRSVHPRGEIGAASGQLLVRIAFAILSGTAAVYGLKMLSACFSVGIWVRFVIRSFLFSEIHSLRWEPFLGSEELF